MKEKIFRVRWNELGRNPTESYPPVDKANLEIILNKYYEEVEVTEVPETPQLNYAVDYCTCKNPTPCDFNTSKCYFCDKIIKDSYK